MEAYQTIGLVILSLAVGVYMGVVLTMVRTGKEER